MKEKLVRAFMDMKRQEVIDIVKEEMNAGSDPLGILKTCREGMEEVGKLFETGEFFLSELIYSAEVFKAISAILEPALIAARAQEDSQGFVVFGTPKGDIHDLGKNIVITMMRAQGFEVNDLGIDVPPGRFLEEIQKKEAPTVLAMSALITPTFLNMRETISRLNEQGLRDRTFVIIGGGVTTELTRKEVGADAQTLDPRKGIELCRAFFKGIG